MSVNLACSTKEKLKLFFDSFDDVLCDCDGVVWKLNSPIDGVKESILKLKQIGKRVRFVSNNCTHSLKSFNEKLNRFHLGTEAADIAFPTLAITAYLKKINFAKEIFLLGMPVMRQHFEDAGFRVAYSDIEKFDGGLETLSTVLQDNPDIGAVVLEIDLNLNYVQLLRAAVYIKRPEVLFIIGGTDNLVFTGFTVPFIGPGHFHRILEDLTGRAATRFGKPGEHFNEFIVDNFNIKDPSRTLFIGDSLVQDMEFAAKGGYQKLLVLSGATNMDQLSTCTDKLMIPDYYIHSLGELHELMNGM